MTSSSVIGAGAASGKAILLIADRLFLPRYQPASSDMLHHIIDSLAGGRQGQ
jgi:hypothetical protein